MRILSINVFFFLHQLTHKWLAEFLCERDHYYSNFSMRWNLHTQRESFAQINVCVDKWMRVSNVELKQPTHNLINAQPQTEQYVSIELCTCVRNSSKYSYL